ncbi:cytochrome P450 [Dactylonectria macrodidyma]|uniref:Cytochrome P450 n=1 Tax=Dactylonectria macrodidyma TaxID=307937 RepID=A0A9P9FFV8_9HYPO|nr:cytochrome P450 [Dactylonectria macrodidyma]
MAFILQRLIFPKFGPREPPVLSSRIPVIGHLISLMREKTSFYRRLYRDNSLPICTLPMLNGKLISSAMRSKDISFDPFALEIHDSLMGKNLDNMVNTGLGRLSSRLNDVRSDTSMEIPYIFTWIRDLMFESSMKSLYGSTDPMTMEGMEKISQRLLRIILPFYASGSDKMEDVSALIRNRAGLKRKLGLSEEAICKLELILPWVATTNTIPTALWFFAQTLSRPEWAMPTISVSRLRKECPALLTCYHETNRLCNDTTDNRRVMRDTILQDPVEGKKYLLTKGTNIQWCGSVTQLDQKVSGPKSDEFNPNRWIINPSKESDYRKSMLPFGGGKALCPGRHFAEAEILGFLSGLMLGFELKAFRC